MKLTKLSFALPVPKISRNILKYWLKTHSNSKTRMETSLNLHSIRSEARSIKIKIDLYKIGSILICIFQGV